MFMRFLVRALLALVLVTAGAAGALATRDVWQPWLSTGEEKPPDPHHHHQAEDRVTLSEQAAGNIGLTSAELKPRSFRRTLVIPGIVVDRPGLSDRGLPAPVAGIVTRIHTETGVAVRPGDLLFTLRVNSEYLQNTQAELFKTASEMALNRKQRDRLAQGGIVPEAKLLELDNQHSRLEVAARAHVQDLLSRGLTREQIAGVERGELVRDVRVLAPEPEPSQKPLPSSAARPFAFEVQEVKTELGQQVQAGQVLAFLANHHSLAIEGRAFAKEAPLIERAARSDWPVEVEFLGDDTVPWSREKRTFTIRYLSNMIDPGKRVLTFQVTLDNEGEPIEKEGKTFLLWRYRPGQRVRLHVPVEEWKDVYVLPAAAVVREGAEVYVFRPDGDDYVRRAVRLLYLDQRHAVLDRSSDVSPGQLVAQSGAAVLNRMLKSQAAGEGGHEHEH